MKKIKVFIGVLVLLLVLVGCTSGNESTRTFEMEKSGVKTTMVYIFKGDIVKKQTTENIIQYDLMGFSSKEEAESVYAPLVVQFENIKGIDHKMEYGDTEAVENMTVDYESVDINEIRSLPGMSFDSEEDINSISMKKSAELLKGQGFTEVE